jgi:tetratricopeptide (TPR) repeat protein
VIHPPPERLEAFGRGDVAEREAATIEDHLASCPDCLAKLAGGSRDDALIGLVRAAGQTTHPIRTGPRDEGPYVPPDVPSGYEILEPIGRGGMGVVYRANQRALGRIVALKQIQAGLDADAQELARFRTEAEAAARLRHPNIVQVYDVGLREGSPYLAMELVEGGSLADRLRRGPLSVREAAERIAAIARAIDHAHSAGIIHRDLKPGNILLAPDGTPKVADFGLAKRLDVEAGHTQSGAVLGTPSYMAPEQAQGRAVGPSADIFALGAILYVCLTGRPPFPAATPLEMLLQARLHDPPAISRLRPGVPRDIQTICLKCLELDPRRRYATAGQLADDLDRFLRDEPISARAVGPAERGLKWARRRPSQAALAGLGAMTLIGSLGGLLTHQAALQVQVDRANRAVEVAQEQRARAFSNYQEARGVIHEILKHLDGAGQDGMPLGVEVRMAQIEAALSYYDRILAVSDSPDPLVRLDTAVTLRQAAVLQMGLGRHEPAERNLARSIELLDALGAEEPGRAGWLRERMTSWGALGGVRMATDPGRALEALASARGLAEQLAHAENWSEHSRLDLAWCEGNLGRALLDAGRRADAAAHFRQAADLRRGLRNARPDHVGRVTDLAATLNTLGWIEGPDRFEEAERVFAEGCQVLEQALGRAPDEISYVLGLSDLLVNWGRSAADRERSELALERFSRGLERLEPFLSGQPSHVRTRQAAQTLHRARALVLESLGRHEEAAADHGRARALDDRHESPLASSQPRLLGWLWSGEHVRAVAEIEELTRFRGDGPTLTGADLYRLAGYYALATAAARGDGALPAEQRSRVAEGYARKALDWLRRCAASGFLHEEARRDDALNDPDFESLRERAEFRQVVGAPPPE